MRQGINRRRVYYIKKDFQRRFISVYILLVLIGAVLANGTLYALLNKRVDDAFYRAHIAMTTTGMVVWSPLVLANMAVITAATLNVILLTLINTWKVGSCIHSVNEGIERIKAGDLTARLRSSDEDNLMMELHDTFNKAVRHLNKRITSIKEEMVGIDAAAVNIELKRGNALEMMIKKIEAVEGHLASFKLRE